MVELRKKVFTTKSVFEQNQKYEHNKADRTFLNCLNINRHSQKIYFKCQRFRTCPAVPLLLPPREGPRKPDAISPRDLICHAVNKRKQNSLCGMKVFFY